METNVPTVDPVDGSIPTADETQSDWVKAGKWPFPFERFSSADPVNPRQERILGEDNRLENMRADAAEQFDESWSRDELVGQKHLSESGTPSDRADDQEYSLMDHGDDIIDNDAIISPNNDYQLNDNVARDLVKYVRSNTVRNEEQFLLLTLAYASGLADDPGDYISSVCIGTSSSGKTHLKDQVDDLFTHIDVMDASTGTDKSLHHDDEWDESDIISMGELQQPSEEMLEFLKRAHGGDEEVVIRQTRGNPSEGFETEKVTKDAKSYHCTYAQFDADFEFWNRLLKLPVHESESKNRAVGRMEFGHEDIDLGNDTEYGYSFEDGAERLQAHMLELKRNAPKRVVIPNGGDDFDIDVWSVVEPIFKHSRSESNRVYGMVSNLIKASAMLNFSARDTVSYNVRTPDGVERVESLVANEQDIANVVRCLDVLRATTHEIDQRKRAVVDAIKTKGNGDSVEGLEPIIEYLDESDASQVNLPELKNILDDLESNYLISSDGDTYTANNWDALGEPDIDQYSELFESVSDPLSGESFLDWWEARREATATTGSDLLSADDIQSSAGSLGTDSGGDVNKSIDVGDIDAEPWVAEVLGQVERVLDGARVPDMSKLTVEGFIGLTDPVDSDMTSVDASGTMLDPDHDVWDVNDKPDEWTTCETDARRHIQQAVGQLMELGHIEIDQVHEVVDGEPVDVTLSVGDN